VRYCWSLIPIGAILFFQIDFQLGIAEIRRKLSLLQKEALWLAFDKKCWLCKRSLRFDELEIEHVLPQSLHRDPIRLQTTLDELSLPIDFDLFSYQNLRPSHGPCNRLKSDHITPVLAFEIVHGMSRAENAKRYHKKLLKSSDTARALSLLENSASSSPLDSDTIERLRVLIDNPSSRHEETDWTYQYLVPNPYEKSETVDATTDLTRYAELGQSHIFAMILGAVLGIDNDSSPLSPLALEVPSTYKACFKGVVRSMIGMSDPDAIVFVQNPAVRFEFLNGRLSTSNSPKDVVFLSDYTPQSEHEHELTLQHVCWVESDKKHTFLPNDYSERFIERLW